MTRLSKASHARRGAMEMDHNRSKYIKIIFLEILAVWCHFESRFLYNRATIRQGSSSFLFSLSFSFSSQSLGSPQRTGAEVRRWCHSWSLSIRFFLISPFEEPPEGSLQATGLRRSGLRVGIWAVLLGWKLGFQQLPRGSEGYVVHLVWTWT